MKIRKKLMSLIVVGTLLMNGLNVYAAKMSVDQAWNQLSGSQQAKLQEVGMDKTALNKLDSKIGDADLSVFISPPLSYANDRFTVSQKNAKTALNLLNIWGDKKFDPDSMMAVFNDVVADINSNSSTKTKEDFAGLLGQYGLVDLTSGGQEILPEDLEGVVGGGGSLAQENIQDKLVQKQQEFKETEKMTPLQKANVQKNLEVLSSYIIDPLASVTSDSVQKAWAQSIVWQEKNANGLVFAKANAPVARWNLAEASEVSIPKGLWNDASPYGRLELRTKSFAMTIEKNTYTNNASKITVKPTSKEGFNQAVSISSTAKIYSPAKLGFYIDVENPEEYGVYQLDGDKEILIGGIYNEAVGAVEALIKSSGTYALKKTTPRNYKDLGDVKWAENQINHLSRKGYIAGKSEDIYGAKDDITRAEFAVLLTRILQLPATNRFNNFKDMKTDAWYYNDVMATVEAKLFNGKAIDSFDPSGKISRQEVAAVISRILVQKGYQEPQVKNVEKGTWAPGALALLKDQSLTAEITGFDDQIAKNANRAEVAAILYNLLQR